MQNVNLGTEKIWKLLLHFSLPCVLSLMISAIYNFIDEIFIGNSSLGSIGIAAIGIVFPIIVLTMAFSFLISDAIATFLSMAQAKEDKDNPHKVIITGIVVCLIISIIFLIIILTCKYPILRLIGATDQTIDLAAEYLTILASFFPIYMFGNCINSVIRSDGSPIYASVILLVGGLANIVFDAILIMPCNLGIKGAAWATVIGQLVTGILSFIYLTKSKTFKITKDSFKLDFLSFFHSLKFGFATFILQIVMFTSSLVLNLVATKYGALNPIGSDNAVSIMSMQNKIYSLIINLIMGLVIGAIPIFAYNKSAKNYARVMVSLRIVINITLVLTLLFTLIIEIFPDACILPFVRKDQEFTMFMDYARLAYRVLLSCTSFGALIKVSSTFFQAIERPIKAIICSLIRDVIILIPLLITLPMIFENNNQGNGIYGLIIAVPIADTIGVIISFVLLRIEFIKFKAEIKELNSGN